MALNFEWDEEKARANLKKHSVSLFNITYFAPTAQVWHLQLLAPLSC
jgi:uncharacterized DUF497 family protein